jgi:hypothetical protein
MLQRCVEDEDEVLFRKYALCEEERIKRHPTTVWMPGQYRWFSSLNIIDLWQRYSAAERVVIAQRLQQRPGRK